ncbi:single-stranded DNA-binding protein [Acidithiobacillus sp.]|uniref:single-stranded DNA-binding protein n=1 Tax=Acidithiobacillus sp. TaxID=1872118 RepID=UPI003CFF3288
MAGVNHVFLLGNVGQDPEMRYTPSGTAIANFSLATSERYKDREGNVQERTEWHRVTLFGRQAEIAGEYLRKGSQVHVEGRLRTEKYTDKEGMERHVTKIIGDRLQLLGRKGNGDGGALGQGRGAGGGDGHLPPAEDAYPDDDIPFATRADTPFQPRGLLRRVRF